MRKPTAYQPSAAEIQAAMQAMLAVGEIHSIKADPRGMARAACVAAGQARRGVRKKRAT